MSYHFSIKSLKKFEDVHPNLVAVMKLALELSTVDFSILEGKRTYTRQIALKKLGSTQTLKSKHLVQADGYVHAVDVLPYPFKDWDFKYFFPIAEAVRKASKQLNIRIRWGGAWVVLNDTEKPCSELLRDYLEDKLKAGKRAFMDAPHFELMSN